MSDSYTGSDNLEVMLDAKNYNRYLKQLVREFSGAPGRVLDFGAGTGTFTDALNADDWEIHCVEPDRDAQAQLRAKGYTVYASLDDIGDVEFDYIFTLNVLEHIEDDLDATIDLFRKLVPNGRLFAYVPAFNHLRTSMDDLVGHHRRYTRATLKHLILRAGFTMERLEYTDFLGYFATLVFKTMDLFKKEPDGLINRPLLIAYDRVAFPVSRLLSVLVKYLLGKNVFVVARKTP